MIFEIVNPSDAYTIEGELLPCGVATMILGEGTYGLKDERGDTAMPIFLFGGHEPWLKEQGVQDLSVYLEEHRAEIATALETVLIGHFGDREADARRPRVRLGPCRAPRREGGLARRAAEFDERHRYPRRTPGQAAPGARVTAARSPSPKRDAARTRDARVKRAEARIVDGARGYLGALKAKATEVARGASDEELRPYAEAVEAAFWRYHGLAIELGEAEKE